MKLETLAIGGMLLAQVAIPELKGLDVGNFTATGILGWYAWYTTSRVIPKIIDDHRSDMKQSRAEFFAALDGERLFHVQQRELMEHRMRGVSQTLLTELHLMRGDLGGCPTSTLPDQKKILMPDAE